MPFFFDIPNHQPTIALIPTTSTSQSLALSPHVSTSLNGMDEIKEMMQSMMLNIDKRLQGWEKKLEDSFSMIQKVSNKVVTLERHQAQGNKAPQLQYQTLNNGRPPNHNYGNKFLDHNRKNSHASTSNVNQSRAIVPQNNMAQDKGFCPSYNYSCSFFMCQKVESYLALTIQGPTIGHSFKESQPKDVSYMQGQGDFSLMNH